jgi:ApaG protein
VSKHKFEKVTRDIKVAVVPDFLEEQSEPSESRYLWSYHIRIENTGGEAVQLLSRHWLITDSRGRVREVRGTGVVGEQQVIPPGGAFEYMSGAPLETPSGFMTGTYQMRATSGESFEIAIPLFALESPYESRRMN